MMTYYFISQHIVLYHSTGTATLKGERVEITLRVHPSLLGPYDCFVVVAEIGNCTTVTARFTIDTDALTVPE